MARPLPDPVLFLDECFGSVTVAKALRDSGARVEVLLDHFPSGTPDASWIPVVGSKGWVAVTKDMRIRHRGVERAAVTAAGIALFALTGGDLTAREEARALVNALGRMRKLLRDFATPFIASISRDGMSVRLLTPAQRIGARKKR